MPLNFVEQKKRQKLLIIILVAALLITGVVVWYGYFNNTGFSIFGNKNELEEVETNNPTNVAIDFSVFENPLLKKLQPFIQSPAYEGKIGRDNPFKR
jgi:hypothetical protein